MSEPPSDSVAEPLAEPVGEPVEGPLAKPAAEPVAERPRCSAKGCRAAATTDLGWRNPRLHDAARVKHWLACDDHADHLADFLARRDFLLTRGPLAER